VLWAGDKNAPLPTYHIAPEYPTDLRKRHIEGTVSGRVFADTLGHVVPGGVWIESADMQAFAAAVCRVLARADFNPFVVDGRRRSFILTHIVFEVTFDPPLP
jgi:hypothetical protein